MDNAFPQETAAVLDILTRLNGELQAIPHNVAFAPRITGITSFLERQITAFQYQQGEGVALTPVVDEAPQPLRSLFGKPFVPGVTIDIAGTYEAANFTGRNSQLTNEGVRTDAGTLNNPVIPSYTPTQDEISVMTHEALIGLAYNAGFEDSPADETELRKFLSDALAGGRLKQDRIEQRKEVNELYSNLLMMEAGDVLDKYGDLIIRGVAKKAGMSITESKPKNVMTIPFINDIKKAVEAKNKLADAVNTSEAKI